MCHCIANRILGSSSRARAGFVHNQRVCTGDHRDLSTNSNYQHGGGRRNKNHSDTHRDGYRDRNNDSLTFVRPRGRQNRLNNFYSGRFLSGYLFVYLFMRRFCDKEVKLQKS